MKNFFSLKVDRKMQRKSGKACPLTKRSVTPLENGVSQSFLYQNQRASGIINLTVKFLLLESGSSF